MVRLLRNKKQKIRMKTDREAGEKDYGRIYDKSSDRGYTSAGMEKNCDIGKKSVFGICIAYCRLYFNGKMHICMNLLFQSQTDML